MGRKRGNNAKKSKKNTTHAVGQVPREVWVLVGLFVSILVFFRWGFIGVMAANAVRYIVGDLYQVMAIVSCGILGYCLLQRWVTWRPTKKVLIGSALLGLSVFVVMQMNGIPIVAGQNNIGQTLGNVTTDLLGGTLNHPAGGGLIGAVLYVLSNFLFGAFGTYLLLAILLLTGTTLVLQFTQDDFKTVLRWCRNGVHRVMATMTRDEDAEADQNIAAHTEAPKPAVSQEATDHSAHNSVVINHFNHSDSYQPPVATQRVPQETISKIDDIDDEAEHEDLEMPSVATLVQQTDDAQYVLPPFSLLKEVMPTDQSGEYSLIERNAKKLEDTFRSFGVDAKVAAVNLGPSVTKFEIKPAVGVKVSKIVNLSDDIALALAAKDIRIEAPIPGKPLIGIEVPNSTTSMVSFREIIEGAAQSGKILEVPLGRDISGAIRVADLTKMPHLLVAGATGSGKSVAINGMITSILMKAKPSQVKLMMIDPKKVELNVYNGIPHLLTPVVTNPRKAAQALQKVVAEMERRYEAFAATGMRNIDGFNEYVTEYSLESGENMQTMPYIVVIVDELADLMMVASNEVEDAIIRLAQMARAAGIHMVLATQRPSVDVITGIIKANVPSRMAFAVSSGIDSRTIIDSNGAEKLLGRGDMLFQPMGESKPIRVQGAFLSDEEVERVVSFIKQQQGENYVAEMMPTDEAATGETAGEPEDELFYQILHFLSEQETISISMLQRKFRIGYNRAARLIDDLEARGLVGVADGSKPRKVDALAIEELLSSGS